MPQVVISAPKLLTADEFASIHGSNLHATMIKNRMILKLASGGEPARAIYREVVCWLAENCSTSYFIESHLNANNTVIVYIEGDADVVAFQLMFNGMDMAEEPAPVRAPKPPPPPPKPIKDTTYADLIDALMKQKGWNEKWGKRRLTGKDSDDTWSDYPILPRARASYTLEDAKTMEEIKHIASVLKLKI